MSAARSHRRARSRATRSAQGIEVRGVTKALRGREILRGVDLEVPRGTVAVIEGDNGAGKTTLVRILATVVTPDSGSVVVNGFDAIGRGIEVRRSIGVSFANERSLYWRINAFQNLELFGKIAGLKKSVIAERSTALIGELHLTAVAGGQVSRMSTGQRQRLMVARALLTNPSTVLLDEPFRGLDEEGLQTLLDLVTSRARAGTTVLIVAPLIEAVLSVADATYRIDGGMVRPITPERAHDESPGHP
jgi:ABC-type multidrug transport system ATPase subunit